MINVLCLNILLYNKVLKNIMYGILFILIKHFDFQLHRIPLDFFNFSLVLGVNIPIISVKLYSE